VIKPTAMVGTSAASRIAWANGVWYPGPSEILRVHQMPKRRQHQPPFLRCYVNEHLCACFRECERIGATDAGQGAGDEDDGCSRFRSCKV
jgi:hypothetical protein